MLTTSLDTISIGCLVTLQNQLYNNPDEWLYSTIKLLSAFILAHGLINKDVFKAVAGILCASVGAITTLLLFYLFGMSFFDTMKNIVFVIYMSLLAFYPIGYNYASEIIVADIYSFESLDFYNDHQRHLSFIYIGVWLAAFTLPLDWRVKWKEWPIPAILTINFLFVVNFAVSLFLHYRKTRKQAKKL